MKTSPFTRNVLDDSVVLTMLIVSVLAFFIMAYKYANTEPCSDYQIQTTSENYYTGEVIKLNAIVPDLKSAKWDFGDNTAGETGMKTTVFHTYSKAGEYTVTLVVNKNCFQTKNIRITEAPPVVDYAKTPQFIVPEKITVGIPFTITDSSSFAGSWEWRFGESANVDATTSSATYTYKTPGPKTITLVVNGNTQNVGVAKVSVNEAKLPPSKELLNKNRRSSPSIVVIDRKPLTENTLEEDRVKVDTTATATKKFPDITTTEMELSLKKVADNHLREMFFEQYFCNIQTAPVTVNGKTVSFHAFYTNLAELKNSGKIKSIRVQLVKSRNTNCIEGINVWMKTKGKFLGIF